MLKDIKKCNKESNKAVHTIRKPSNHHEKQSHHNPYQQNPQIGFLMEELKSLKE